MVKDIIVLLTQLHMEDQTHVQLVGLEHIKMRQESVLAIIVNKVVQVMLVPRVYMNVIIIILQDIIKAMLIRV